MGANPSAPSTGANNDPTGDAIANLYGSSGENLQNTDGKIAFLGMQFTCTLDYFKATIRETWEILLFPIYIFLWCWVQIFVVSGLLFPSFRSLGLGIRESWNSFIAVMESTANTQWANYNLFRVVGLQNLVCDRIMYRYWLFHFFNQFVPEMNPYLFLRDIGFDNSPLLQ